MKLPLVQEKPPFAEKAVVMLPMIGLTATICSVTPEEVEICSPELKISPAELVVN